MEEKEPARVKPFEEVKDSIAEQLKKQGVNDKMQATVDQARAALLKAPGSAADVAKQFGLELVDGEGRPKPANAIPSLGGVTRDHRGALAGMKPNDVSDSLLVPGNKIALVVLNRQDRRPSPPNSATSRPRCGTAMSPPSPVALANQAAQKAAEQARAGEDLEAIAKSHEAGRRQVRRISRRTIRSKDWATPPCFPKPSPSRWVPAIGPQ